MAAACAEAVQFQSVSLDHKAVFCRDLFLESFDLTILKFYNGAATGTDKMVVMTFVRDVVVLRLGAEVPGLRNAGFAKEIQRAVDRGKTKMRVFLCELMIHGLGRHVFLSKKGRQDQLALAGQLQLMLGQVLAKHLHFFEGFAHGVSTDLKEAH